MRPFQVVLPQRVVPQPQPALYSDGDCGACVLAGLIGTTVEAAYQWHPAKRGPEAFDMAAMRQALYQLAAQGLLDRLITEPPEWDVPRNLRTWGRTAMQQSVEWFLCLVMALDAGYCGVASVDSERRGVHGPGPDHWVLLVGARRREVERDSEHIGRYWSIEQELLVSNSSTRAVPEEWVEVGQFLRWWGGFNVLLARPGT